MKYSISRLRSVLIELMHLDDTPNNIALSAAIGIFWNFIPTLGLGVFVSVFFAKLLKVRMVVAATANLCTGFFIPFFYTLNFITGGILTRFKVDLDQIEGDLGESITESVSGIEEVIANPKLYFLYDKIHSFSADFLVGSIVNAVLAASLVYLVLWFILNTKRKLKKPANK